MGLEARGSLQSPVSGLHRRTLWHVCTCPPAEAKGASLQISSDSRGISVISRAQWNESKGSGGGGGGLGFVSSCCVVFSFSSLRYVAAAALGLLGFASPPLFFFPDWIIHPFLCNLCVNLTRLFTDLMRDCKGFLLFVIFLTGSHLISSHLSYLSVYLVDL